MSTAVALPPSLASGLQPCFGLRSPFRHGVASQAFEWGKPVLERLLGLPVLNGLHDTITAQARPGEHYATAALRILGVECEAESDELARIPQQGGLLVTANHPFGGIDGLALLHVLRKVRPDVKLLANELLGAIPQLAPDLILVDLFGDRAQRGGRNGPALREAVRWLREGHVLGVFPAGEVAHATWRNAAPTDPMWNPTVSGLARLADVPALPVHFGGRNSAMFHFAGLLHPRLRTAMLPWELIKRRSKRVRMHVGSVVISGRLRQCADDAAAIEYLRVRTYLLGAREGEAESGAPSRFVRPLRAQTPVAGAVSAGDMRTEIERLPEHATLLRSGGVRVLHASAAEIPCTMREVGRLREEAFRAVGEGSGKSMDLDEFDGHYTQLIAWNEAQGRVVGGYRLGLIDRIMAERGMGGLYTSTLFRFSPHLLQQIGEGIELGRAFVNVRDQKSHSSLALLWKGIGHFLARHPTYRYLMGPVSISAAYRSMSRHLMMTFMQLHLSAPGLAHLLTPRNPPKRQRIRDWTQSATSLVVSDLSEVDALVGEIERHARRVPVLLRQYQAFNARLLAFNVDETFGECIDGLMLADLPAAPRRILDYYMTPEGAKAYLALHNRA